MSNIKRLLVEVPRTLEKTLGYRGRSRWLELYGEPEVGLVCKDNQELTIGSTEAWRLFVESPNLKRDIEGRDLYGSDSLLLDRRDRNLYVGERSFVDALLEQSQLQEMLLLMDNDRPRQVAKYRLFGKKFAMYSAVCGVVLGTLGGLSYGGFRFYQWAYQSESVDTSTPQSPEVQIPPKATSPTIPDKEASIGSSESSFKLFRTCIIVFEWSGKLSGVCFLIMGFLRKMEAYCSGDDLGNGIGLIITGIALVVVTGYLCGELLETSFPPPDGLNPTTKAPLVN